MSSTTTATRTTAPPMRERLHGCWQICRLDQPLRRLRRHLPINGEDNLRRLRRHLPINGEDNLRRLRRHLPINGEDRLSIHVFAAPCFESRAVAPRLGHAVARLRSRDPRPGGPSLPVDEALVLQEIGARMVLRIWRRHTLQLLPLDVISLPAQLVDDPYELRA